MARKKDPRIDLVVKIMQRSRIERIHRAIKVGDMRRKDGRVTMQDEARKIIAALDAYDAAAFDAAFEAAIAKAEARS